MEVRQLEKNKTYLLCHHEALGITVIAFFADENDAREMYVDLTLEEMYEAFLYFLKMEDIYDFCNRDPDCGLTEIEIALEECEWAGDYFIIEVPYFN